MNPQAYVKLKGCVVSIRYRLTERHSSAIKHLACTGMVAHCTDGKDRQCHPVIAGIMADYEEQAIMTCMKSGWDCTICTVPANERENLCKSWLF